ncbi:MAG: hypothetical protein ACP5QZ_03180 [Candidatus Sumerlaeaceae bacterium]
MSQQEVREIDECERGRRIPELDEHTELFNEFRPILPVRFMWM